MTTLVALATKDTLVMGCDSLGSVTTPLIDPVDLIEFFDSDKEFELKLDAEGKPKIKSFYDIYRKAIPIPIEHMTHTSKLFSLDPLRAGVMFTGITSIGERTVKSLVEEFIAEKGKSIESTLYSIEQVVDQIREHIMKYYKEEFEEEKNMPKLELIIGGYCKKGAIPEIYRIKFPGKEKGKRQLEKGHFGIVFGGQMKEIERIVFGRDFENMLELKKRHTEILRIYRKEIIKSLQEEQDLYIEIPEPTSDQLLKKFDIFANGWDFKGFYAKWGDFSEQNAIECVDFFVNIMIKSQQFGRGMPTVGGEVHVLLITKDRVKFVSKEEYHHEGHYISKHDN